MLYNSHEIFLSAKYRFDAISGLDCMDYALRRRNILYVTGY